MSSWIRRMQNKRKHIDDLKRMLTWDYPEEYKQRLQQEIDSCERDLERHYN